MSQSNILGHRKAAFRRVEKSRAGQAEKTQYEIEKSFYEQSMNGNEIFFRRRIIRKKFFQASKTEKFPNFGIDKPLFFGVSCLRRRGETSKF
jgi:hypothetical protein